MKRAALLNRRVAWWLGFIATSGLALVGLAYAWFLDSGGDTICPVPNRSSDYGTFSWSVIPPGPRCTFTLGQHGLARVDGPGPYMSLWLLTLLVAAVLLYRYRDWRGDRPHQRAS